MVAAAASCHHSRATPVSIGSLLLDEKPPFLRVELFSPPLLTWSNAELDAANRDQFCRRCSPMPPRVFFRGVP